MAFHNSLSSYAIVAYITFLCLMVPPHAASSGVLMAAKKQHSQPTNRKSLLQANQTTCALSVGTWVRDYTYPMYNFSQCAVIDDEFNCQKNGRPDSNYLRYRWKPHNCELPRFDGLEFLKKMRGKTIMFVGDSLGRNQWESLICMISVAVPKTTTTLDKEEPLSTFKFWDYNVKVSFYRAQYLVDIDTVQGKRLLRLDNISRNGNNWRGVDVLSFNTGHWWSHTGSLAQKGWNYIESGGIEYKDMDRLKAFEEGLRTWAKWVDTNINISKTRVFFQAISPTHLNRNEWNTKTTSTSNKNCYGETVPVGGTTYPGAYPDQMRKVEAVIRDMKRPAYLLNITMLSQLRKDGHPSIYSGTLNPQQRVNPDHSADCSHWCLPGLPDTWNQLFYTALIS